MTPNRIVAPWRRTRHHLSPAQLYTLKTSLDMPWNDVQALLQTTDGDSASWLDVRRDSRHDRPNQTTTGTECAGPLPSTGPANANASTTVVLEAPAPPAPLTDDPAMGAAPAQPCVQAESQVASLLPPVVNETPLHVASEAPLALPIPVSAVMDGGPAVWPGTAVWRLDASAAWGGAGLGWVVAAGQLRETLTWNRWLDMSTVGQARLEFQSRLASAGSMAGIEV